MKLACMGGTGTGPRRGSPVLLSRKGVRGGPGAASARIPRRASGRIFSVRCGGPSEGGWGEEEEVDCEAFKCPCTGGGGPRFCLMSPHVSIPPLLVIWGSCLGGLQERQGDNDMFEEGKKCFGERLACSGQ